MIRSDGNVDNLEKLEEGYDRHYDWTRAIASKQKLLEWYPKDRWEPLFRF